MRKIKLTQGEYALVDNIDFERLNKHKWYYNGNYAVRGILINKKPVVWRMHWDIMGKPEKGLETDHINRNKLDNRKSNLREITQLENNQKNFKYKK